jgi:hypothetical protein
LITRRSFRVPPPILLSTTNHLSPLRDQPYLNYLHRRELSKKMFRNIFLKVLSSTWRGLRSAITLRCSRALWNRTRDTQPCLSQERDSGLEKEEPPR